MPSCVGDKTLSSSIKKNYIMAATLKHWREAATLILVTSSKLSRGISPQLTSANIAEVNALNDSVSSVVPVVPSVDNADNFDILLLKRSSRSKFMPNLYVFPGGVAVNNDFSNEWLSVFRKLGADAQHTLFQMLSANSGSAAPLFARPRDQAFSDIPSEVAFRICAIRETFEESGVLLALPVEQSRNVVNSSCSNSKQGSLSPSLLYKDSTVINLWRKRVNEDPNEFLRMCLELDLIPEIWSLYEWSNWLTPALARENFRRFDTIFFVCCVDHKPEAVEDAAETVNAVWASPSSLLSSYFVQNGGLAVPQVYELSRLINFQSARQLLMFVANADRSRIERWLPCLVMCKDYNLEVLPGDDLYPKHADPTTTEIASVYSETLEELNSKFPKHHRVINLRPKPVYFPQCTLPQTKEHVYPCISVLNSIRMRPKL